jgi:hypothetical protein
MNEDQRTSQQAPAQAPAVHELDKRNQQPKEADPATEASVLVEEVR